MSASKSILSCTGPLIGTSRRYQSLIQTPNRLLLISKHKENQKVSFLGNDQRLQLLKTGLSLRELVVSKRKMDVAVYSSVPGPSIPSDPSNPGQWKVWIFGVIASVILPFFGIKFGPLLKIKKEVDTMVETAEDVVEAVEKVAEEVDKVAEEIKERLPAGGKLRVAVTSIENVAERTAKDAQMVDDIIDKVQEVEEQVESFIGTVSEAKQISKEASGQKST